ncbi:MAG: hypothetical protein MAG453_02062 [Calditrichaeota bacterium]|nr:hypothetical protein [Calditrichota bacterium]
MAAIGIRYEDKSALERRAPLTPDDVRELREREGIEVHVQPSPNRIFTDEQYREAGARLTDDLSACDLIAGIKEVPAGRLIPGKPHLFFSHVIKGQRANMPLLREILARRVTLIDYERVTDERGIRLIAFSRQAGQAGTINGLWSLGQRFETFALNTPLARLKQAFHYAGGLLQAKAAIAEAGMEIRLHGLPEQAAPLVVGITGGPGRVSMGAQDVLAAANPVALTPSELRDPANYASLRADRIYQVVFDMPDFLRRTDGGSYRFQDYLAHPEQYESYLNESLPYLSLLVNGVYWEERYPRLVTLADVRVLYSSFKRPRPVAIADVTCDVGGSVESTRVATSPDNPVYVYNPATGGIEYGFAGEGLLMMTVDILPSEIPRESSQQFGAMIRPYLPELVRADYTKPFAELAIPEEFRRAVIAHHGDLTPGYRYLESYLQADNEPAR